MRRTVRDLVDAFRVDEERAFDPEAVWRGSVRRARQRTLRRRTAVALAGGLAAAAAIGAPTVALTAGPAGPDPLGPGASGGPTGPASTLLTLPPTPPPSAPTRAPLSETLREVSEGGWLILPTETDAHLQRANVVRAVEGSLVANVVVYESSGFDPSLVLDGIQTTVDGVPAYFAWTPDPFRVSGETRPALAWQHAPDAWVVVRMESATPTASAAPEIPDELLEVASLVEIGQPEPIRLPFRLGYRPETLVAHSVTHFAASYPDRTVYYEYIDAPVDSWDPQRDMSFPLHISMRPPRPDQWRPETTVGGRPAMRIGDDVIVAIDDLWIVFGCGAAVEPLPIEEVERIFTGLTFADWSDQSTWFDANTAT